MKKYQEVLDWLRETTISLEHNKAYNILQELIDQQKQVHVGDKVRFKEEYKVHTEVEHVHTNVFYFYCGKCHEDISEDWTSCPYCTHEIDWIYDNWEDGE